MLSKGHAYASIYCAGSYSYAEVQGSKCHHKALIPVVPPDLKHSTSPAPTHSAKTYSNRSPLNSRHFLVLPGRRCRGSWIDKESRSAPPPSQRSLSRSRGN